MPTLYPHTVAWRCVAHSEAERESTCCAFAVPCVGLALVCLIMPNAKIWICSDDLRGGARMQSAAFCTHAPLSLYLYGSLQWSMSWPPAPTMVWCWRLRRQRVPSYDVASSVRPVPLLNSGIYKFACMRIPCSFTHSGLACSRSIYAPILRHISVRGFPAVR